MRITKFQRKVKIAKWEIRQDKAVCECYGVFSNMTATNSIVTAKKAIEQIQRFNNADRKKKYVILNLGSLPF